MESREFACDMKCICEIRVKKSLTYFIYLIHFFYPWCLFWLSARTEAIWHAGYRSWRGHYQQLWVDLTPEKLKRNYYFISGYTFNASCIHFFFPSPRLAVHSQNPFLRLLLYIEIGFTSRNLASYFSPVFLEKDQTYLLSWYL